MNESPDDAFPSDQTPAFFALLNEADRKGYETLRAELSSSDRKFKRYKRVKSLQDALMEIQRFCRRGADDDWKRYLVCGVCWVGFDIAINTRQLRLLINKCKSSINGALAKMGYSTAPIKGDLSRGLVMAIPFLKGNFAEQRMWTIRRRNVASPAPVMSLGMMSSPYPGMSYIVTPQPTAPPEIREPACKSEIQAVFGVSCGAQETPAEESKPLFSSTECCFDKKINFFQDPLCCCPSEWVEDDDDVFSFG